MTFIWYTPETRTLYAPRPVTPSPRGRVAGVQSVNPVSEAIPPVSRDRSEQQQKQGYGSAEGPERHRVSAAKDIMTAPVFTLHDGNIFSDAWRIVNEKGYRHIPICMASGRPVGVVSERDLYGALAALELSQGSVSLDQLMITPVTSFMKSPLLTAAESTSIRDVARVMFEEHVGCIPILDEVEQIRGIITRSDILRAVLNDAPLEFWV